MSVDIGTLWISDASRSNAAEIRVGDIAYWDDCDDSVSKRADDICLGFVRLGYDAEIVHSDGAIVFTKDDLLIAETL